MLLFEDSRRQRLDRIIFHHLYYSLRHDRSVVELFIDYMHGAAGELHAMRDRLALRIDARECREK